MFLKGGGKGFERGYIFPVGFYEATRGTQKTF